MPEKNCLLNLNSGVFDVQFGCVVFGCPRVFMIMNGVD